MPGAGAPSPVGQDHDPVVVGAELELVLGQDHPRRLDPAELRLAQLLAAGHDGAGKRHRDGLARGDVWGAADDRPLALAVVDDADAQAVGVRVLLGRDDVTDDESVSRGGPTVETRSTSTARIDRRSATSAAEMPGSQYSRSHEQRRPFHAKTAPGICASFS